ncbi:nitrile hydratase accessory protein [Hoeflea prorocentri]|uniref:Nitrile hydratase accessory protein n=1 Tax=Hoeflea prorocentri TaxID=1922333 RepID=A0A9X3UIU4_9HYPH|nr:nitrile hydratase accessory protein [Hoeflea prorocentri]MCY6379984.1 nitrile hydratase accessory protein [Hoeflea prorocentri]MDA5397784.1 nitrile hydratase accessory protein [Hoeflea prorocentri]
MSGREGRGVGGSLPKEIEDPSPFTEPWQAQAFAMAVELNQRGLFTWAEWADTLSLELKRPGVAQDGSDYYTCWMRALEKLITAKSVAGKDQIDDLSKAWARAANATPHGQPILLENDPHMP